MASKLESIICQLCRATCARCCYCHWVASDAGELDNMRSIMSENSGIGDDDEEKTGRLKTSRSKYYKRKSSKATRRTLNVVGGIFNHDKNGIHRYLYSVKEEMEPEDSAQWRANVGNDYHRLDTPKMIHWNDLMAQGIEEPERQYPDEESLLQEEKPSKLRRVSRFFLNLGKWFENIKESGASEDGED